MYQQPGDPNAQNQNPYYPPGNSQWPSTGPDYPPASTDQSAYAPPPSYYPTSYPPTQYNTTPPPYAPQSQYGYQGGPGYPPPTPPRKSNSRLIMIIAGIVLAILVIGGGAYALGHQGGTNATTTPTPAADSNTPATGSTPAAGDTPTSSGITPTSQTTTGNGKVGQAVQAGPNYAVTVNSVKTSSGDSVFSPKSGNTYLVIDVTVKNTSSSSQDVSSLINFELQDATGQKYTEAFTDIGTPPDQTGLAPGGLIRGQLVYEVPTSMHQFTLSYVDLLGDGTLATWSLTD